MDAVDVTDGAEAVEFAATLDVIPVQPFTKVAANIAEHTIIRRDIISPVGRYAKNGRALSLQSPVDKGFRVSAQPDSFRLYGNPVAEGSLKSPARRA
jgi:hypothetical protein